MQEWAKVILVGVVGWISGVLTHPIRAWIERMAEKKQVRDSLYRELASFYALCLSAQKDPRRATLIQSARASVFQDLYEHKRTVIHGMKEADAFITVAEYINNEMARMPGDSESRAKRIQMLHKHIDVFLDAGLLGKKRLVKEATKLQEHEEKILKATARQKF